MSKLTEAIFVTGAGTNRDEALVAAKSLREVYELDCVLVSALWESED